MQWLQYPLGRAMPVSQGNKAAVPSLRPQSSSLGRWRALPSLQRGLGERYALGMGRTGRTEKRGLTDYFNDYSVYFNDIQWFLSSFRRIFNPYKLSGLNIGGDCYVSETTKMWGGCRPQIILHQCDLSHRFIRFHTEKTQEELHFTPRPLKLVLGHLDKWIRAKRS